MWGMSAATYLEADEDMRALLSAVCDTKVEWVSAGGDA